MDNYKPPFTISEAMLTFVASIMEKIGLVNNYDNLSKFPHLRKNHRIRSIHSSCAIEANSLSLDQVSDVIDGIKVIGPEKDIIEIQNIIEAYRCIEKVDPLNESELKQINGIIGRKVIKDAGSYRKGNQGVADEDGNIVFIAPPPRNVPILMAKLFGFITANYNKIHPLILSSIFHYEFVFIHPFNDGNGRTARLWQNVLLGKWRSIFYWLPLESFIFKFQNEYYEAISQSHIAGESNPFIEFMLKMIDLTLEELISETTRLSKSYSIYVNKLIAAMEKGVWYTANEILSLLNLKSKETLRKNYLNEAIKNKLIVAEFPEKPTSRNQRYKLVDNERKI
ncbi:MAG: Fic family protein [Bacilli bacterium]|jgi:Fic family protein